jgi:hypothetical protein
MKAPYRIRYITVGTLCFCISCSGFPLCNRNRAGCFPRSRQDRTVPPASKMLSRLVPLVFDGTFHDPRSPTSLSMFLPPGGGNDDKSSELREVTSAIVTFVGLALFFISPLGGIFFALFNSFLAFVILLPIGAFAALNVWQYFNTVTGTCPNCGVGIKALKDESPTICLNCGSIVQAKDGQIYLANSSNEMMDAGSVSSIFSTWMKDFGSERKLTFDDDGSDSSQTPKRSRSSKSTIIDVDVKEIDD